MFKKVKIENYVIFVTKKKFKTLENILFFELGIYNKCQHKQSS